MNHSRAVDLLSAYLERDLGDAERADLEAHLADCTTCRAELADLRGAIDLLRRLPDPEPPAFLATRVMARIAAGETRTAPWRRWLEPFGAPWVAAPLAAAGAALLVFAVAMQRPVADRQLAFAPTPTMAPTPTIVARPVGPVAPVRLEARQLPDPRVLARHLRGASHPHSTALAAHFDDPVRAVAYSGR